jgi:hypothetical protein
MRAVIQQFSRPRLAAAVMIAFLASVLASRAQTLRVTAWDLHFSEDAAVSSLADAARELRKLAPDVILLRDAGDWKTCSELVQALRPADYRVVTCSAFPGRAGTRRIQAAIIARRAAYFSWSQAWATDADTNLMGGFAFAALETAGHRVGFYSVILDAPGGGFPKPRTQLAAVAQLLSGITIVRNWAANRVEAFVTAGPFQAPSLETEAGSALAVAGYTFPFNANATADLAEGHLPPNSEAPPGLLLNRWPATCDFDFEVPPPAHVAAVPPPSPPAVVNAPTNPLVESRALSLAPTNPPARQPEPPAVAALPPGPPVWQTRLWMILGGVFALLLLSAGLVLRALGRRPSNNLLPARTDGGPERSYTVVITPGSASESVSSGGSVVRPTTHLEALRTTQTQSEDWRARALEAENRAAKATALVKSGMMGQLSHWLKASLAQRLISDRARLLEIQEQATLKAIAVDERLSRLEVQLQKHNQAYEKRIEELTRDLLSAREENRELIRAQITRVKAEMEAARERMIAEARSHAPH